MTQHFRSAQAGDVNAAYERMLKGDVKYRFVIDMGTLGGAGGPPAGAGDETPVSTTTLVIHRRRRISKDSLLSLTPAMLAKLTAKNQITLPKAAVEAIGATEYLEVETRGGVIILTPVRIQRGDAVRAKLAELALTQDDVDAAVSWARLRVAEPKPRYAKKTGAKSAHKSAKQKQ